MAYRETPKISQRKAALRQRLLQSAEGLVREGGFKALAIQAVATQAGVSVGSVYRYFANKDELATEVFRHSTERELAAVAEAINAERIPKDAIAAGARRFAERAFRAPSFAWALIAEPVEPAVDAARIEYRRAYTELFEAVIAQGLAAGSFSAQVPALSAAALVGALAEALLGPLQHQAEKSAVIDEMVSFSLRAVGAIDSATIEDK
jgi:AcrR family transcriptional regulator